ncbi:MAG: HAD-IA family hydrolase [Acidimicrobiales bacterium]|nr:HAD-IA family hydrolase [Acidimicrobiales bacterium]
MIRAALFDFGGVILSSPFEAFARYEQANGLPDGFIRGLNATNPDTNAWARLERSEVDLDRFCALFEDEARAAGRELDARGVIALLSGSLRPAMVEAVRRCGERLRTGLLTNNFVTAPAGPGRSHAHVDRELEMAEVMALFDAVVESSQVGVRKPDPRFYELACELLAVAPEECVFLDDLGVNLKPARAMGMTTIKVVDPGQALAELEAVVGFPLG